MEIFYSNNIDGNLCILDAEEAGHCVKVLRHHPGDEINVIDGQGSLMKCRLVEASPKQAVAQIVETVPGWGGHPYFLTLAVAPTKNSDRYEWFAEKACEIGVDKIAPVIGEHSERRIFKAARIEKILLSAAKQSLKGAIPQVCEPIDVKDFIRQEAGEDSLKLIAYCFEDDAHPRTSIKKALEDFKGDRITVLIGPEGDFSKDEAALAIQNGFIPVHLGASRLRTETAAVTAAEAVYFKYI